MAFTSLDVSEGSNGSVCVVILPATTGSPNELTNPLTVNLAVTLAGTGLFTLSKQAYVPKHDLHLCALEE